MASKPPYKADKVVPKRTGIREDIGPSKVKPRPKVNRLKTGRGEDKALFRRGGRAR